MANQKLGKLGNLGNLGKVVPSFLVSKFSILRYSQNRKLGFNNLGKKFSRFPRFPSFPSFSPGLPIDLFSIALFQTFDYF